MQLEEQYGNLLTERNWSFSLLALEDLDTVMDLYHSALGQEGCAWDEHYPTREIISADIQERALYGLRDEQGKILGVIARDRDPEVEALDCWDPALAPGAEFARLVVAEAYQNQGIARLLLACGMRIMADQGFRSVHYLVAAKNQRARRSYHALQFHQVGEVDMFGEHFLCFEKEIGESR